MAARASVGAMGADGSDRVHVVGTLRLCRSIRAPPFHWCAPDRIIRRMNVALTVARLGYAVVGLAALVVGWDQWQVAGSLASLLPLAGGLALAAAAWVGTDGVVRGAIASIGIVVGALLVAMPSLLAAAFLVSFGGDIPRAVVASIPVFLAAGGASIMWRVSRRPWDRPAA